jgi:hypothetical protein
MAHVVLVSTTDLRRAVETALKLWNPALEQCHQATLVARQVGPGLVLAEDLLDEVIVQVQSLTAAPIRVLAEHSDQLSRGWLSMAQRQGVTLHSLDRLEEGDLNPPAEGQRLPRLLSPDTYSVQLLSGAALGDRPFVGLARAPFAAAHQFGLTSWQPSLNVLDAVQLRWPGTTREVDLLAMSDDPLALDLLATALYRQFRGPGPLSDRPLAFQTAFVGVDFTSTLPLQFTTEGGDAAQVAQQVSTELQPFLERPAPPPNPASDPVQPDREHQESGAQESHGDEPKQEVP